MKDLVYMGIGCLAFSVIVFGAVTAGAESADGSNTRNGVIQGPALPEGITAEANRLQAPNE
ncbi:MAG TPA: hypothetical protein VFR07_05695 [Mycobacteriales bacterium]|jgi:hypothetical protein|nr:hypothetical protein [Mycobacteriales bacterium]